MIHDYYDCSIELIGCRADMRLSSELLQWLWAQGFDRVWLWHQDGMETFYYKTAGGYGEARKKLDADQLQRQLGGGDYTRADVKRLKARFEAAEKIVEAAGALNRSPDIRQVEGRDLWNCLDAKLQEY